MKTEVEYSSRNLKVYCWEKSKIILKSAHVKDEPLISDKNKQTMGEYIIANYFIDNLRSRALSDNYIGPRILITGSPFSGEKEFCHTLLNYSLKLGYTPIFCDLDLENEISVPGAISAALVDDLVPNDFLFDNGITFFTGTTSSKRNENMNWSLYEMQLVELGNICIEKLEQNLISWKKKMNIMSENNENKISYISPSKPTLFSSGLIVNCPMIENDEQGKNIYKTIIDKYKITTIYVIENEKLKNVFKNIINNRNDIDLSLISRLTGNDSDKNEDIRRQKKITKYFKGPFNNFGLKQLKLDMNSYKFMRIIPSDISSSMVPIGSTADLKMVFKIYTIKDEEELLKKLVCFVYLDEKDIKELDKEFDKDTNHYVEKFAKATVSYFGFITLVDKENNKITICCPFDEPQHKYILVGNIKYDNNKLI